MIERAFSQIETLELKGVPDEILAPLEAAFERARRERWAERLFDHDPSLWTDDANVAVAIGERLGWLDAPDHFVELVPALEAFGEVIRNAGFEAVIVGGMGGSSLVTEVLADAFGGIPDWLPVKVLDSTHPEALEAVWGGLDPLRTLFIVATKSGTTTETVCFQADAWERIRVALDAAGEGRHITPGAAMVAITDPGRSLAALPHQDELREVFLNPPDIGGRYSALSYVGLVPASLLGVDLDPLLASAIEMTGRCRGPEPLDNPGLALGLVLGTLSEGGRNKLTLLIDPEIGAFGAWLEQLIAESTGKQGRGIVPIDREPLGSIEEYAHDRIVVRVKLDGGPGRPSHAQATAESMDRLARSLAAAGQPVIGLRLADPIDLGAEFVRWEVATAIAGAVLRINPFDEPNVAESKENTERVLRDLLRRGRFPDRQPVASGGGLTLYGDRPSQAHRPGGAVHPGGADRPGQTAGDDPVVAVLGEHVRRVGGDGYLAFQVYLAPKPERDAAIARLRSLVRRATRLATTGGYGPRYLHSTGQLHKGGPATGGFIQITAARTTDRAIPGRPYSFGNLIDGQSLGDVQSLQDHGLPVLEVRLGPDVDAGLAVLEQALGRALTEA